MVLQRLAVISLALLATGLTPHSPSPSTTAAHRHDDQCSMFPANNLYYPPNTGNRAMSYAVFNRLLNHVENVYGPEFRKFGTVLRLERAWEDPTANAYARSNGFQRIVKMFGGLARHPLITADGFLLVACHEIGHHLGGAPLKRDDWASSEGESDYFGTLKCMRKMLRGLDNESVVSRMRVDPTTSRLCNKAFNEREDILICIRSVAAGKSLATVLSTLREGVPAPRIETPDSTVVKETQPMHPAPQCRLDTYLAGSICTADENVNLSMTNVAQGSCDDGRNRRGGQRPLCWFNPSDPREAPKRGSRLN